MGPVTVGVIVVIVICLAIFALLSLAVLLGGSSRRHW
jgi:hypothetical protein